MVATLLFGVILLTLSGGYQSQQLGICFFNLALLDFAGDFGDKARPDSRGCRKGNPQDSRTKWGVSFFIEPAHIFPLEASSRRDFPGSDVPAMTQGGVYHRDERFF